MNTLFLDFDGVLFDTVLESYLLARYAYYGIEPQENFNKNEYDIFHKVRHLITNSWHYYYIMKLIDKGTSTSEFPSAYKQATENRNINADGEFDKKFQSKRKDLINNHFEFWNKLDTPYPFFEMIKSVADRCNIVIVSTKNEEAILRHCRDYGLDIKEENVIGKTKLKEFGTKKSFLSYYIETNNIKSSIFIDDSKSTIEKCASIPNLKTFVANWGYVADKNDGQDEKEIFNIIKENI